MNKLYNNGKREIRMIVLPTIIHKINGTNGKFCAKVAFPRYTESVKFKSQSRETA